MATRYIIRNATVVSVDTTIGVRSNCDVLIEDSLIKSVGKGLSVDDSTQVIDGTDCTVSPGFVDTHRHMWQTQLAGLLSNHTLSEYVAHIRSVYGSCYSARDAYVGNYVGALQCLEGGTTFVVDHSHIMNSPSHADEAVRALREAHIRGVFCYGFYINPIPFWRQDDTGIVPPSDPDWRLEDSRRVKERFFCDNSPNELLRFGVALNEIELTPITQMLAEVEHGRALDAATVTSHCATGKFDTGSRLVRQLNDRATLGSDMLFSHGGALQDDELEAIKHCQCGLSCTPDTELQMAMAPCVPARAQAAGISKIGLGSDVSCSTPPDMFAQMRLWLQYERNERNQASPNGPPRRTTPTCEEALELATVGGARAVSMEEYIGSITPGKRADLVMIRCDSLRMSPVHDPVAALVSYANASDVDTVFVDGKIVKQGGKLVGLDWPEVRKELVQSTADIIGRTEGVDFDAVVAQVHEIIDGARQQASE